MSTYHEPGRVASGVLAVGVHVLFIALLVFGLSWQRRVPEPLVAELWRELPTKVEPVVKRPEPPPPPPAPKVEAPPPKPMPPPEPKVEPPKPQPAPQASKADIELKEKQRKLREQKAEEARQAELQRRQAELEKKQEAARKKEEERKAVEAQRREELARQQEQKHQEEARRREEEQRLEEARRQEERNLEREAEARRSAIIDEQQKLAQEARRRAEEEAKKRAAAEAVAARQRQLDQFIAAIKQKIHSRVVVPSGMTGNPQAIYSVTLLPGGEVLDVRLVKSSGVPAYDAAVERAIHAADPLPVPSDPEMFQQQFRQANYAFRPLE
jgi:colicin import membrane protein